MAKKKSVSKTTIIADLSKASGLKKVQVKQIVDGIFDSKKGIIVKALKEGRGVALAGFGKFFMHHKKATKGGKRLMFGEMKHVKAKPASWIPKFRYAKATKEAI